MGADRGAFFGGGCAVWRSTGPAEGGRFRLGSPNTGASAGTGDNLRGAFFGGGSPKGGPMDDQELDVEVPTTSAYARFGPVPWAAPGAGVALS